jgi:hypothetical protein
MTAMEYVSQHKLVFLLTPSALIDGIPGLSEDDNPVLMLINLK